MQGPRCVRSRTARTMSGDESGGMTIWALVWFSLFGAFCGLAVDTTDGFRTKTGLQATADAAVLAAVQELPDEDAARAVAIDYAGRNLPAGDNGNVLMPEDIQFGRWDPETRFLEIGATPANAARVWVRRSAANDNPLPVNFLRIIGLRTWDVNVVATAQQFLAGCLGDGLLSRKRVEVSSNNRFIQKICVHGAQGVSIQQNNYFEEGVIVSMNDLDDLALPSSGFESNEGLEEALREQKIHLGQIDDLPQIFAKLKNPALDTGEPKVIPDYIDRSKPVIRVTRSFDFANVAVGGSGYAASQGRIFWVDCAEDSSVDIEGNKVYQNVVIIADRRIHVRADALFTNVVMASTALGNGSVPTDMQAIDFASNTGLGLPDKCAEGGACRSTPPPA